MEIFIHMQRWYPLLDECHEHCLITVEITTIIIWLRGRNCLLVNMWREKNIRIIAVQGASNVIRLSVNLCWFGHGYTQSREALMIFLANVIITEATHFEWMFLTFHRVWGLTSRLASTERETISNSLNNNHYSILLIVRVIMMCNTRSDVQRTMMHSNYDFQL